MLGLVREFREFAMRGNVVDMAVGIIIGAAFGKVVSALVEKVMMPPLGYLMNGVDFSRLAIGLPVGEGREPVLISYGDFINAVINFVIVAFALFVVIKAMNTLKRKQEAAAPAAPPADIRLLTEIRDLLRKP